LKSKDQYAILSYLASQSYIINYVTEAFASKFKDSSTDVQEQDSLKAIKFDTDLESNWKATLSTEKQNSIKLSMKPPTTTTSSDSPIKETDTINDPFDYFIDKYFASLYQLTMPLTFFTKSAFARLRSLCPDPSIEYEAILKQFVIDFDTFDARHLISNNGLLNSQNLFEIESIHRDRFLSKSLNLVDVDIHSTNYSETNKSLANILNTFKIRELQLQLIILLELISLTNSDDLSLLNKSLKPKKQRTGRLIGRRKLVPVINGSAIVQAPDETTNMNKLSYLQHYDGFVDRLLIWDTLNSTSFSFSSSVMSSNSTTSSTSTSDYSSAKFINNVIIPYMEKKCPNSVKHMIKKIKGPSFRSNSLREERKRRAQLKRSKSELSSLTHSEDKKVTPKLEDLADIRLSRSNSDLQQITRNSSFNVGNLSRREIDVSVPAYSQSSQSNLSKPSKKTVSTTVFNRVGKRTSSVVDPPKKHANKSFSQVSETPIKKQKNSTVITTPQDDKQVFIQQVDSIIRPYMPRDVQSSVNSDIPINSSVKSVHKSLPLMDEIMSSGQSQTNKQAPSLTLPELQSPLSLRSSFKKPKPGDPYDFEIDEDLATGQLKLSTSNVKRRLFPPTK
jgi:DNA replication regulator SLD3